jgi:predicted CXXCH cytochrome family protein
VKAFLRIACGALFVSGSFILCQTSDVIGIHNLGPGGGSPVSSTYSGACWYCHAPHSGVGGLTPLWNQQLSTASYTTYTSSTNVEKENSLLPPGSDSALCLSCHDGTVAPGQTQAYGKVAVTGQWITGDNFGTGLQNSHPFSLVLPIKDSPDLAASIVTSGQTLSPNVKLIKGNIECDTCHNPHAQATDKINQNFLVQDSSSGQLCLACHDPTRVTIGQVNPIAQWTTSAHALSTSTVAMSPTAPLGAYHTVGQNACSSCHQTHNAIGSQRLLRAVNEQDCMQCHGGGSNISPGIPNVFAEFGKVGHPFPSGTNMHDAAETTLLNQNRHSTCADCHNSHASQPTGTFTVPPLLRPSQNNVAGISANDGFTVLNPSVNQFENCLRCHGYSTGKVVNPIYGYLPVWVVSAGDPLNVIPQFAVTSTSSHPVTHVSNSVLPQPSLRQYMLNLDGITPGRGMGVQIFCSDCHNADDNREFGGTGPNGPHGSKWTHILERRYEFSQAVTPGGPITNLFPNPDLSVNGPYALCGKCHDLSQVLTNSSFTQHSLHINYGFSCSACHTAHGMGSTSGNISGERMVNFDANVVAANPGTPIQYMRATNSCTLTCHTYVHTGMSQAATNTRRPSRPARK